MKTPYLAVSDEDGNIFEIPGLLMTGMSLSAVRLPSEEDLVELPFGSNLFMLPWRIALGYDPVKNDFVTVDEYRGKRVFAASAFMAPAYLQLLRASFVSLEGAPPLPLYSYTALGFGRGKFWVSGMRIDTDSRQDLDLVDLDLVHSRAQEIKKRYHGNRLASHLVDNCVCRYGCPAARNFALLRWECPLPTSVACNSACLGCISKQPASSGIRASQDRIAFVPEPSEIAEIAVPHLESAERAVVSFGQGCEGEPLTEGDVIEKAIREIRKKTDRGVINLNTNGSMPDVVERLADCGLDSIRVSLNSAQEAYYSRYFNQSSYSFEDVIRTLSVCRNKGLWVSVNYFMYPGFTDRQDEMEALDALVSRVKINMIQTRNINIDPEWYNAVIGDDNRGMKAIGIRNWVEHIRKRFPWIKLGYFNPPREEMKEENYGFSGS